MLWTQPKALCVRHCTRYIQTAFFERNLTDLYILIRTRPVYDAIQIPGHKYEKSRNSKQRFIVGPCEII